MIETDKNSRLYKFVSGNGGMNLPNKLTISRVVMIPVFIALFYVNFKGHYFAALAVFLIASLTDLLDGKIARKYNLVTNLGKFLDPIADKILVLSALVVMLTVPDIFTAWTGRWAITAAGCGVAVILAREIIVSGFRMVAAGSGTVIAADIFGKYKTVAQDLAVIILLTAAGISEFLNNVACKAINYAGLVLFAYSVILTVLSGVNYLVKNREVLKK